MLLKYLKQFGQGDNLSVLLFLIIWFSWIRHVCLIPSEEFPKLSDHYQSLWNNEKTYLVWDYFPLLCDFYQFITKHILWIFLPSNT